MRIVLFCILFCVITTVHAGEAITRWAFPDSVSVRDTVHIGLVAYGADGIDRVEFALDRGSYTAVSAETKNPSTGEYEYVYTVDGGALSAGYHTISANVYPNNGSMVTMDQLSLDVVTGMSFSAVTVNPAGGDDHTTLGEALNAITGGDTIYLADGEYAVPESWTPTFERWVHILPAAGSSPSVIDAHNVRKGFLKWSGIAFDGSGLATNANLMRTYSSGNHWFDGCLFTGLGKENYNNGQSAFRMTGSSARNVIVENCTITGVSRAFVITGPQSIIRNNLIYDLSSDIFNPGGEILITGNEVYGTQAPKLYLEAPHAPPFDFSVDKDLMISHCEATNSCDSAGYNVYTIADMGSEAADPAATTLQEAIDALNANTNFFTYCWAENRDGKLRIYARRSNYVQQMWVTGGANTALGIPQNSLAAEASGAGAHSDIFQYWGNTTALDTLSDLIFRNNKAYFNHSQGIFPGADRHSINTAYVNNLVDAAGKGGWNVNFTGSRNPGEHFENVLFEFNTIWDQGQALLFSNDSAQVDITIRNNIFGRRALGAGDRTAAGFDMDYNYWISYYGAPSNVAAHSVYQAVTLEETGGLFTFCTYNPVTEDDTSDFVPAADSPVRDIGSTASGIAYDIDWNLRDGSPDMGAFEYRVSAVLDFYRPGRAAFPAGEYRAFTLDGKKAGGGMTGITIITDGKTVAKKLIME